ncbi:MAG: DUF2442 domain-containing protein [Planctomycetota bacterium]
MHTITRVEVLDDYRVDLCFADGTRGVVDLSDLAGRGVFKTWQDYAQFRKVKVGETGELVWPSGVDLCADSLYFKVTGKRPEEEFPALRHELSYA